MEARTAVVCTVTLGFALGATVVGTAPAAEADKIPVNTWTRVSAKGPVATYDFSRMIYAPGRGQLLHWGGVVVRRGLGTTAPNDVRALDASTGRWVSDYSPDTNQQVVIQISGTGKMLPSGIPAPAVVVNGVCYDSKRKQVVYTMPGLMAAYDPTTRKWTDLEARAIVDGKEYRGGPPLYGAGTGYDPINDEIVLFPHWKGNDTSRLEIDGLASGHSGTFRYSFKDNTWRRVSQTFGTEEVKRARRKLLDVIAKVSKGTDGAHALRRARDLADPVKVKQWLSDAAGQIEALSLSTEAAQELAAAVPLVKAAASAATAGNWEEALRSGGRALWELDKPLKGALGVEPPPRCGTPLVYNPKLKCLVMFGGSDALIRTDLKDHGRCPPPGSLNDTWLYDCTTRQWREIQCRNRPPVQRVVTMVYDPASAQMVLGTFSGRGEGQGKAVLWTLDPAKGEWFKRHEQKWPGALGFNRTQYSNTPTWTMALDEKSRMLVMTYNLVKDRKYVAETCVLRLDLEKLPAEPAPAWAEPPPIKPQIIPPDDPAWVAKLKTLPANTWVRVSQPRQVRRRDWGNAACDPVRGHVYYFGGGHSSYQVNDVAVYITGANRWIYAAGDMNELVPPKGWGGCAMGFRGGASASHQSNTYVALDGRMYKQVGVKWYRKHRDSGELGLLHFYDLDRGGQWRMGRVRKAEKLAGAEGFRGGCHMVSPVGRVLGFAGRLRPSSKLGTPHFNSYDIYTGGLTVRRVPHPMPGATRQCRPFCYLTGKDQVFCHANGVTWVYDISSNKFTNLHAKNPPAGNGYGTEYLVGQDAVFMVGKGDREYVYSFRHNAWQALAVSGKVRRRGKSFYAYPYVQMCYVAKYGVLVNAPKTSVMRPDVSKLRWE